MPMRGLENLWIICLIFLAEICMAQQGMVGYWSFDKFSIDFFRDESGNSNNGTAFHVSKIDGVKGSALRFYGEGSYAKITGRGEGNKPPSLISNLAQGSVSVWFKVEQIPLEHGIAPILYFGSTKKCDFFDAANQGLIIEVGHSPIYPENENLFYTVWADGCTYPSLCFDSDFKIIKGVWNHFVVVVGEDYNTGFLNGEELVDRNYNFGDKSHTQFFKSALAKEELWLGKGHWDRTEQYFNGSIDELKIFNRVLTAEEVKKMYNSTLVPTNSKLDVNSSEIAIYPNPTTDKLEIEIQNSVFKIRSIIVTDVLGSQVIRLSEVKENNIISLQDIPEGIYFVNIIGDYQIVRKKILVVQK